MDRPVYQKMGITKDSEVLVVDGPVETVVAISLPSKPDIRQISQKQYDHIVLFVKNQRNLNEEFPRFRQLMVKGGKLWVAWPKSGQLGTDLNIKEVIRIGYDHNLVESVNLRIDNTWTALKFTHPKPGKTYNNSYGTLPN